MVIQGHEQGPGAHDHREVIAGVPAVGVVEVPDKAPHERVALRGQHEAVADADRPCVGEDRAAPGCALDLHRDSGVGAAGSVGEKDNQG